MQNVGADLRGWHGPWGWQGRGLRGGRGVWGSRQWLFGNLRLCSSCQAGALWQAPFRSLGRPECGMAQIL